MYIGQIHIDGYRCFKNATIDFVPGVNLVIGENNSGKTALLQALGLVFERRSHPRMQVFDFCRRVEDLFRPPCITVEVTLRSEGEGKDEQVDRALAATWLTSLGSPWEAKLTYHFELPEEDAEEFVARVGKTPNQEVYWGIVAVFLPKYVSRIYGGKADAQVRVEPELLAKFGYQFIGATRDAASELFRGSNPLLGSMLQQVLDHDIWNDDKKSDEEKRAELTDRQVSFRGASKELTASLRDRIDLQALTSLVRDTGAEDGGTPRLSGSLNEQDLISSLKLFVERAGLSLPADYNGLGYNNLVYISLVLASLDFESDYSRLGENTIVFPLLLIEEPESHLHPALQYKLLRFVKSRQTSRSRQVFLTTHSTHITAACDLDSVVCLSASSDRSDPGISYPGRAFPDTESGRKSKMYVERYLDATKSTMLFAKGVVLVEGLGEQLLIPCLAEYAGLPLDKHHVALVAVGGSTFKHFLPLFGAGAGAVGDRASCGLTRRVACVLDGDPMRKHKNEKGARWKNCWPEEIDADKSAFEYRYPSAVFTNLSNLCQGAEDWILIEHGTKTLEYDLAMENAGSAFLAPSDDDSGSDETASENSGDVEENPDSDTAESGDIDKHGPEDTGVTPNSCLAAESAKQYLLAIDDSKGEHAFILERRLRANLARKESHRTNVVVPEYIKRAIVWACGQDVGKDASDANATH